MSAPAAQVYNRMAKKKKGVVGIVGLGIMGGAFAHNLHAAIQGSALPEVTFVVAELQRLATMSAHRSLRCLLAGRQIARHQRFKLLCLCLGCGDG